jgi:hypothetical protein
MTVAREEEESNPWRRVSRAAAGYWRKHVTQEYRSRARCYISKLNGTNNQPIDSPQSPILTRPIRQQIHLVVHSPNQMTNRVISQMTSWANRVDTRAQGIHKTLIRRLEIIALNNLICASQLSRRLTNGKVLNMLGHQPHTDWCIVDSHGIINNQLRENRHFRRAHNNQSAFGKDTATLVRRGLPLMSRNWCCGDYQHWTHQPSTLRLFTVGVLWY